MIPIIRLIAIVAADRPPDLIHHENGLRHANAFFEIARWFNLVVHRRRRQSGAEWLYIAARLHSRWLQSRSELRSPRGAGCGAMDRRQR